MKSTPRPWAILLSLAFFTMAFDPGSAAPAGENHIGLQLYSLRAQFGTDVPATLAQIKSWGITNVELAGTYKLTPEKFKAELHAHGLNAFSGHVPYDRLRNDLDGVVRDAQALGVQYVGCAWISHGDPFDEKTCREAAGVFNRAGEALSKHGLKFFYHTHGYEFQPFGEGTLFDLLMQETNPKFVNFQMDVFWVAHAGQDPVKLLEKFGPRWQLMHVKGMRDSTPTGLLTGHSAVTNDVAVGTGKIDYAPIVKTAKKLGIQWYVIEDESPASEQQVPQSYNYLQSLKW